MLKLKLIAFGILIIVSSSTLFCRNNTDSCFTHSELVEIAEIKANYQNCKQNEVVLMEISSNCEKENANLVKQNADLIERNAKPINNKLIWGLVGVLVGIILF